MPNSHFVDAYVDGTNVSKTAVRNGFRDYVPLFATAAELQALTSANIRLAIVFTANNDVEFYRYDSTDTTTADDGFWTLVTSDGKRFKRVVRSRSQFSAAHATEPALLVTQTQAGTAGNVVEFRDVAGDTTPFFIDATGFASFGARVSIGHNAVVGGFSTFQPGLTVTSTGSGSASLSNSLFSNSNAGPSNLFGKSRGTTIAAHGAVLDGDTLGNIICYGSDGAAFVEAGRLLFIVDGTPGSGDVPMRFEIRTGGATPWFTVKDSGSVQIGNAALATSATTGFLYIPTTAGAPTGVPSAVTGLAPIVIDTTNNKLWSYIGGAWKGVVLA